MSTTPGTDNEFAQIKVPVEFDMENRRAETVDVLCDFAIHFCNIPANLWGPILNHAISIYVQEKWKFPVRTFIFDCSIALSTYVRKAAVLYRKHFNLNQKMHFQMSIQ